MVEELHFFKKNITVKKLFVRFNLYVPTYCMNKTAITTVSYRCGKNVKCTSVLVTADCEQDDVYMCRHDSGRVCGDGGDVLCRYASSIPINTPNKKKKQQKKRAVHITLLVGKCV